MASNPYQALANIGVTSNKVSDIWKRKSDGRYYVYLANWKDKTILEKILNVLGRSTVVEFDRVQSRTEPFQLQDFVKVEKHLAGQHNQESHASKRAKTGSAKTKNLWVMTLPATSADGKKVRKQLAEKYGKVKVLSKADQRSIIRMLAKANASSKKPPQAATPSIGSFILTTLANNPELTASLVHVGGMAAAGAAKRTGQGIERIAYPYGKNEPENEVAGRRKGVAEKLAKMAVGYQPSTYYKASYESIVKSLTENNL